MPTYILGTRSLANLTGVHLDLVAIVKRAIEITSIDFAVVQGIRTVEQQREYVRTGASQTMDSRHLTGHAVDLVPFIGNTVRWELTLMYPIATAIRFAALEMKVPVRWGGCWSPYLTASEETPEDLVGDYVARKRAAGQRSFVDGGHFELPRPEYP
jgi:peptidoglycan LD-endopeptidase CwlK